MGEQLFYEDLQPGADVPPLVKTPTTRQLVQWAAGSGDFHEVHYDLEFARQAGLANVIVHGRLKAALLAQMITDWIGPAGSLRKFSVRYKEVDFVGQQLTCQGRVAEKYERDGEHWVECDVWTLNAQGKQATTGKFAVTLPSRDLGGA